MQRVSSRQRLVSWDAFDASARASSSDNDSDYETAVMIRPESRSSSSGSLLTLDSLQDFTANATFLKRKRTNIKRVSVVPMTAATKHALSLHEGECHGGLKRSASTVSTASTVHTVEPDLNLMDVHQDVLVHIFSFLDVDNIRSFMQLNHHFRRAILSDETDNLWKELCVRRWPWLSKTLTDNNVCLEDALHIPTAVDELRTSHANLPLLLSLSRNKCSAIDETIFPPVRWHTRTRGGVSTRQRGSIATQLQTIVAPNGLPAVQFLGIVGQGDRCIRADLPLPRPDVIAPPKKRRNSILRWHRHEEKKQLFRPFVAPFVTIKEQKVQVHLTPRLLSYFEVTILPADRTDKDCIAIGIATSRFSLHTRMPGWDGHSYGYHGDDGGIFHGHGTMVRHYAEKYGPGDTVGCGIDYISGSLFFTVNGTSQGTAFELGDLEMSQDWFPVVGMDSACPVQCNFGTRPFMYNLLLRITRNNKEIVERV